MQPCKLEKASGRSRTGSPKEGSGKDGGITIGGPKPGTDASLRNKAQPPCGEKNLTDLTAASLGNHAW
jgi:hypothetical protein